MAHLRQVTQLVCTGVLFCIVFGVFTHRLLVNRHLTELNAFIHYLPWWGLALAAVVLFCVVQKLELRAMQRKRENERSQQTTD